MTENEKKLLQTKYWMKKAQARAGVKERKARTQWLIQEGAFWKKHYPVVGREVQQ